MKCLLVLLFLTQASVAQASWVYVQVGGWIQVEAPAPAQDARQLAPQDSDDAEPPQSSDDALNPDYADPTNEE